MRRTTHLAVALTAAAALLHAGRAWAPFHLVVIDQVFFGTEDCPGAQYVMMRMTAPGQTIVQNQSVRAQGAGGQASGDFGRFTANLSNPTSGAAFIIGTADAAGLFGIAMDATAGGRLETPDGRVCFGDFAGSPVDCVAYGAFTGDNPGRGQPALAPPLGLALIRNTNTSNNAQDFSAGAPAPRNNAGMTGTLGQCPSAAEPTPTATLPAAEPTATATGLPLDQCPGDCDGDGQVVINELVLGVGVALGAQPLSACDAFDTNASGGVEINELVAGVRAALDGCPATA